MVLISYRNHTATPRVAYQGSPRVLEPIGEIIRELYPADLLVSSDEDDLDDSQLEVLEEIADHQLALRYAQPVPIR
jgi:hypothetical protein